VFLKIFHWILLSDLHTYKLIDLLVGVVIPIPQLGLVIEVVPLLILPMPSLVSMHGELDGCEHALACLACI